MITKDGIFVEINDSLGSVDSISYDRDGLSIDCDYIVWIDREGHYNPPDKPICPRCGDENKAYKDKQKRENHEKYEQNENQ